MENPVRGRHFQELWLTGSKSKYNAIHFCCCPAIPAVPANNILNSSQEQSKGGKVGLNICR